MFLIYLGMPNTTIENPPKNKTLARAYVTKSLNELYIKAGGIGKIQFKNWENQKMEVVGWPEEIPFQEAYFLFIFLLKMFFNVLILFIF